MIAFARALEIIPRQICDNAGIDSTDVLNKLRQKHAKHHPTGPHSHTPSKDAKEKSKLSAKDTGKWYGVDVDGPEGIRDNFASFVWEPSLVKVNAISSAAEAACLILSVDETVRGPQSEQVSGELPVKETWS